MNEKNIFSAILGAIITLLVLFYVDNSLSDKIQSIATVITALTVAIGFYQLMQGKKALKVNHNWNRRQLAMQESVRIMKEIKEIHEKHDISLKYTERKTNEPYFLDAEDGKSGIHDLILKVDEDGKRKKNSKGDYILSSEGRILAGTIKDILNNYEYIASGISEKTFDEGTIKRLSKSNMIKAYKVFELYIDHLREFYKRPLLYKELEKIITKWMDEDKVETTNRSTSEDED